MVFKEPRGVIWNSVVRASFFNVFFTINSKYHVFDMIFSASILTFSCGSNGMGPNILFSAICEVRGGGSIFQKACFLEIKEYALNTSLKKRVFPIEIVKIDIWMIISYLFFERRVKSIFFICRKHAFWKIEPP